VGAELGCVTPYIVAPGYWSADDIAYYADEIVAGLVHNAGHNCTKAELLVTDATWPQRPALVAAVRCGR
jgi:acyl-CoA reductase-like NAD-dependent aldehyde dehydrogenase